MTDRITTQKDINEVVWRACDTLRGTIDPTQYKDYILVLLFLKYVSDLARDQRDKYGKRGSFGLRVERVRYYVDGDEVASQKGDIMS